jgi:hypothetical protein
VGGKAKEIVEQERIFAKELAELEVNLLAINNSDII